MKEKRKIISIMILIITISFFTTVSYGFQLNELTGTQTQIQTLQDAGNNVMSVVIRIGMVISVVALIILGIKYMLGSTSEKAEYKKTLIPYVIGASLLFAATSIAQLIYSLAIQL